MFKITKRAGELSFTFEAESIKALMMLMDAHEEREKKKESMKRQMQDGSASG